MIPSLTPAINSFLNGLTRLQSTITTATNEMSSGYRISQPSDAPDQISPLLQLQASLSHSQTVSTQLTRVQADVAGADQAVNNAIQLLGQARSIGAQGANGTTTAATRASLAQQIASIQEQMAGLANTQVSGRYIFSGDLDSSPTYALANNPSVPIGRAPASVVKPGNTVVFNIYTAAGANPPITIAGQPGDTLQSQIAQLNTSLQGLGISATLDATGMLQFTSANAFSVSAQASGATSLVSATAAETANNTGLNHYQYAPQAGGGGHVQITFGASSAVATLINPAAPQQADVDAINAALQAQGITSVSAVLDQTAANRISFQGSSPFSISDDHAGAGYVPDGNSIPSNGVNRLVNSSATRRVELSDHAFITVDQTAQDLFDHRNADGSPAQDSAFFALNALRVALADGTNPAQQAEITSAQQALQQASDYVNSKEAFYGNTQNRIDAAINRINTENASLQQQISAIRDTDVVQTALELTSAETQTQAALTAESKVPHTSLFDFLG